MPYLVKDDRPAGAAKRVVDIPSSVAAARDAVAALYPSQLVDASSPQFAKAQESFWNALQRENAPACFFQPTNAKEVSKALVEVIRANAPFAIKGGGHSSNIEGSSIHNGFQFDLCKLNHVRIAENRQTVDVGPGQRWGAFYEELEKEGLIAVGGRDAGVGVPGFIFGGGLSYYSSVHGWGIDNLVSVDMVLADGQLVTVDQNSHPDLHKALRGGGAHNFGIVTNLKLKVYPFDNMWGGLYVVTEEHFDALFDAYDTYSQNLAKEGKAHMIVDFARQEGNLIALLSIGYPEPVSNPPIYDVIRHIPNVLDTLRIDSNSNLAKEEAEATDSRGVRNLYWVLVMDYNLEVMKKIYAYWKEKTTPYVGRISISLDFNHITPAMRNKAARDGNPNIYNLEGPDEPLSNILLTCVWEKAIDDEEATRLHRSIGTGIEDIAKERGIYRPFKYMNYANHEQDVIASFGSRTQSFLKNVAAKYDPQAVFQKLQPGAFKLDRSQATVDTIVKA